MDERYARIRYNHLSSITLWPRVIRSLLMIQDVNQMHGLKEVHGHPCEYKSGLRVGGTHATSALVGGPGLHMKCQAYPAWLDNEVTKLHCHHCHQVGPATWAPSTRISLKKQRPKV